MNKQYNVLMKSKESYSLPEILHKSSKGAEEFNWQIPRKEEGWSDEETKCKNFEQTYIPSVSSIAP